jgi:hypothetical protein
MKKRKKGKTAGSSAIMTLLYDTQHNIARVAHARNYIHATGLDSSSIEFGDPCSYISDTKKANQQLSTQQQHGLINATENRCQNKYSSANTAALLLYTVPILLLIVRAPTMTARDVTHRLGI